MNNEQQIAYPIELGELMRLWLDFGWRLHVASIGEDGLPAINADEAIHTACEAVAIGASDLMIQPFNTAFPNPEAAAEQIARRAEGILSRVDFGRAAATNRTAEIFATRFGIAETPTTAAK